MFAVANDAWTVSRGVSWPGSKAMPRLGLLSLNERWARRQMLVAMPSLTDRGTPGGKMFSRLTKI